MISLTPQQQKLLTFIKHTMSKNDGVPPRYVDMATHMGFVSKSGVHRILIQLEKRGRIVRLKGLARAIEIIDATCPHCGGSL